MIEFRPITDWRKVWQLCDGECDVTRLFDDARIYSRQNMKHRIRQIVEASDNRSFEVIYDGAQAGCFILYALKDGTYETHIVLKAGFRGRRGVEIGRLGTDFALGLPGVKELVAFCPDTIKESFVYAQLCGWQSLGVLPVNWIKDGINHAVKGVCARRYFCRF